MDFPFANLLFANTPYIHLFLNRIYLQMEN